MPQPKKTLSYSKQKEIWYKKLKQTGFNDIESDENNLKVWSSKLFKQALSQNGGWEAKYAYYQMAQTFLNEYEFETNADKIIWMYHSEGISARNIAKLLNKLRKKKVSKWVPQQTIKRLDVIMKTMYLVGYKGE